MGFLFNSGKKAAKIQAAATSQAAESVAKNDRVVAQGAVQTQQTLIAQKRASDMASEILSTPQGKADVSLAADVAPAEIDATTGRRKTARSSFMSNKPGTGIRI